MDATNPVENIEQPVVAEATNAVETASAPVADQQPASAVVATTETAAVVE